MTEQKSCTLCGAEGHFAAQCSWGPSLAALMKVERENGRRFSIGIEGQEPIGEFVLAEDFDRMRAERDALAGKLPEWPPCNKFCMPEHGGHRDRRCNCEQARRALALQVSEPCKHVFSDNGMFTVACTECGLYIEAKPSDAVMDQARQQAYEAGGVDDGSYLLTGDDFDQILAEACATTVIEYATASAQPSPVPALKCPEVVGYACLDDIRWGGDITLRPEKSEHYSVPFAPVVQADQEYPYGSTVKLQWAGAEDVIGWAHRGENGELLSAFGRKPLDSDSWTVLEEREAH